MLSVAKTCFSGFLFLNHSLHSQAWPPDWSSSLAASPESECDVRELKAFRRQRLLVPLCTVSTALGAMWFCCDQTIVDFICDPSSEECSDLVQWACGDTACLYVPMEDACGCWPCGLWSPVKDLLSHEYSWRLDRICLQRLWFMMWKDW